jgi:hypothetical protein
MTPISIPCPHCGAALKVREPARIGHRAKCPKCAQAFFLERPESVPEAAQPAEVPAALADEPSWPAVEVPCGAADRLQVQRRRNRRRTIATACVGALILLAAGSVAVFVARNAPEKLVVEEGADLAGDAGGAKEPVEAEPRDNVQPIDLQYVPAGSRIVIHVHPKEFWRADSPGEEFRFCLGPIAEFFAAKIRELSRREPSQIAEALFCLISNEQGTPPDLAAVFRLPQEVKKSELLDQFGGRRAEGRDGTPYYLADNQLAYLFPDGKTIAVCPAKPAMVDEMLAAVNDRNPTSPGIEELLRLTDRERPLTVMWEPVSARLDAEFLVPSSSLPLMEQFLERLGADAETVAWSVYWKGETFHSEMLVRNQAGREARVLERELRRRLDGLAEELLDVVRQMSPNEVGKRKIIGRVPAMAKAFALASRTEVGPRYVKVETRLPERAAPNLALGALLTWDESTRSMTRVRPPAAEPSEDAPDTTPLAEKLRRRITVDFRREPLQGAFAYIANEIKARLEIDGDALKLSAYTKNMPQTFAMENVPAIDVIERILKQPMYEKMCLVVDNAKNSLLITTYPVAEQQGLRPYEFSR